MFAKLFGRADKTPRHVTLRPLGRSLLVPGDEPILDAALRQGVAFPNKCRAGVCGTCKCRVLDGKVKELTDSSYTLSAEELRAGYVLACQSVPRSDLTLELPAGAAVDRAATVQRLEGKIAALRRLADDIVEIDVQLSRPLAYRPGQYADVAVPGVVEEARSFSFANAPGPNGSDRVQFHVRRVAGGRLTPWLLSAAAPGHTVRVEGPFGDFGVRDGDRPMLCVAGGTGFAPIKAMLDQLSTEDRRRDVVLYYGARTRRDLYCQDYVDRLGRAWQSGFRFTPVLSEEPGDSDWTGARGLVTETLALENDRLSDYDCYLCGPPGMIDAATAVLEAAGVPSERIQYDKFLDRSHLVPA